MRVSKLWIAVALSLALVACARINDKALGWVATDVNAFAIVDKRILVGTVSLVPDRTARVVLAATDGSPLSCAGSLWYTATGAGAGDLRCSDGHAAAMRYSLVSETRGYGYAKDSVSAVSLTFGLSASDARAYLAVPQGHRLVLSSSGDALVLQAQ